MEDHSKAKIYYNQASQILTILKSFKYETKYFTAWNVLEEAEFLSKKEEHEKAIKSYLNASNLFNDAKFNFESISEKVKDKLELGRIDNLIKIAQLRLNYCFARIHLEEGRSLAKAGEKMKSAEKFASAASEFLTLCDSFKREKERLELKAVFYLCKAWESMELAETYQDATRFSNSAVLFKKSGDLNKESKLKLLAEGNANICLALEKGCYFDQSIELNEKAALYPPIKLLLRNATDSYRKGGFEKAADWAFATSSYFDAAWKIIQADLEIDLKKKKELLDLGSSLLKTTAEKFGKAGYANKEREIIKHFQMVKEEAKNILSALNTIKQPDITHSTTGIVAPSCALETSLSPKLGDLQKISEEIEKDRVSTRTVKKYQISSKDILSGHPERQKSKFNVGIAQIGVSRSGNIMTEFYQMKESGLLGIKEDKINKLKDKVKKFINQAKDNAIDLLIFPEMVIDLNYKDLLTEILEAAKSHSMYIIPGSFHDINSQKNISIIIGPDGILWEQEKHIPAIIHFGEQRFKENIQTSSHPKKIVVCNTELGRIAITICRDFLDMDLRVELKNTEPPVDIIVNPAFTPVTVDFKAAHFDARRSIFAYCFFANVAEYGESFIYTPEKDRTEIILTAMEEGIISKEVDLFKLRSERKKWEKEQLKEKQFIQSTRS
jgi:predicted amidohydrolase